MAMTDKVIESPNQYFTTANIDTIDFAKYDKVELEIGCGRGDFLAAYSPLYPDTVFIGVERHLVSLRKAVKKVRSTEAHNNSILINADFLYLFESQQFPPNTFDAIHLYFPDPWPKKKHQKRRLVTLPFLGTLKEIMKVDSFLHLRSDNEGIYSEICDRIGESNLFSPIDVPLDLIDCKTSFEKRFLTQGKEIFRSSYRIRK